MMVKDATKLHKCHLGVQGMLECVCAGFHTGFSFWKGVGGGENSKVRC